MNIFYYRHPNKADIKMNRIGQLNFLANWAALQIIDTDEEIVHATKLITPVKRCRKILSNWDRLVLITFLLLTIKILTGH